MSQTQPQRRFLTTLWFALGYVFSGSIFLGIDIAIQPIPPALMCGSRFLVAGVLMLLYCRLAGQNAVYSWEQFAHIAIVGILLLVGGNLMLSYAELYVPTG